MLPTMFALPVTAKVATLAMPTVEILPATTLLETDKLAEITTCPVPLGSSTISPLALRLTIVLPVICKLPMLVPSGKLVTPNRPTYL